MEGKEQRLPVQYSRHYIVSTRGVQIDSNEVNSKQTGLCFVINETGALRTEPDRKKILDKYLLHK